MCKESKPMSVQLEHPKERSKKKLLYVKLLEIFFPFMQSDYPLFKN